MTITTIEQLKQFFRNSNSIYIDHAKDPQSLLSYIYRLERMELIYATVENKEFNMSIYAINHAKNNLNINFK